MEGADSPRLYKLEYIAFTANICFIRTVQLMQLYFPALLIRERIAASSGKRKQANGSGSAYWVAAAKKLAMLASCNVKRDTKSA
eukprot:11594069-Ditylum_brightwellii.AAC.1